ncbi:siderophore-interacting protein [Corynebacterium sp. CCM 9185]|uniref:Siderophore-interacting protein n=1 Tax=Corynebacterium marambiense TaxID=2765364 RepID=A0ABS0VRT5_9CORY|nr:siderophore-interacting protein [Corynebacterium marambiense]MBI8999485.1 siderophore-interacting protein [Corynebacterium marambiense]MCK7662323.1 siderophore-interacting protein [Corynebacterium marambiense]
MARSSRHHDIYPISIRELEVIRTEDVTPGMRRVVLGGPGLRSHVRDGHDVPAFISDGFDDDVRIIFPDPVTGSRPYPPPTGDGRLQWNEEVNRLFRTYTVRHFDADEGEVSIDFARHGHGLAEGWALSAAPGAKVWVAGPKRCGVLPTHTDHLVLVGDATALPAIGRCLEELPASASVTVLVEVAEQCHIQQLDSTAAVDLRWIVRADGGDLAEEFAKMDWPEGRVYVWCAGEAGQLRAMRQVIKDHDVDPADRELTGYWREQAEDDGGGAAPVRALARLADVSGGLALRAAVRTGIFTAVGAGHDTPAALAAATGMDESITVRFLRYLESQALLRLVVETQEDGPVVTGVRLTAMGRELADPESSTVQMLAGPGLVKLLAFLRLDAAVCSGGAVDLGARADAGGLDVAGTVSRVVGSQQAAAAAWTAPAVIAALDLRADGDRRPVVGFMGAAAASYAEECAHRRTDVSVVCLCAAGEPDVQRADGVVRRGYAPGEQVSGVDTLVVVDPFARTLPGDVADLLAATGVPRLVLVTQQLEESAGDAEDYEADLIRLCVSGASVPTRRDIRDTLGRAGYVLDAAEPAGWGFWRITATRR